MSNRCPLIVNVIRHGHAKYAQNDVSIDEANDLKVHGVWRVQDLGKEILPFIGRDEVMTIWSSTFPRTLQSARILAEFFAGKGVLLRPQGSGRSVGEQAVFQTTALREYVMYPRAHQIKLAEGERVAHQWRMLHLLRRLSRLQAKTPIRILLVTHDVMTAPISALCCLDGEGGLAPGTSLELELQDGQARIVRGYGVEGFTPYLSDVFAAYERKWHDRAMLAF